MLAINSRNDAQIHDPSDEGSDLARLRTLLRDHYLAVWDYAYRRAQRDFVEDVAADTFVIAWRHLDELPVRPRPWLLAVARNVIATELHESQPKPPIWQRLRARYEPVHAAVAEPKSLMGVALARLSVRDREAIALVTIEELTPAEAAVVLDITAVRFRLRLGRAKRRLRRALIPPDDVRTPTSGEES